MNNNDLKNKNVYISGKAVITDWRKARIVSPENIRDSIRVNEAAINEVKKQTEVAQTSSNLISTHH
jgi:hypothetical protein